MTDIALPLHKKSKIIAFQIDDITSLNPKTDSSLLLGLALQDKGYDLFFYEVKNLSIHNGVVYANGIFATLSRSETYYIVKEKSVLKLNEVLLVIIRQDPPFNMCYITSTYILDLIQDETLVLNDPTTIRNLSEKFSPLLFRDFLPPFLITADITQIKKFILTHQDIVLKPMYQHGGLDVVQLNLHDPCFEAIALKHIEKFHHVIVQEFISNVLTKGDKRVLLADGNILGYYRRLPLSGDFRSNTALGGDVEKCSLTKKELEICDKVGAFLKEKNVFFAGLDILEERLIEINITSPTGLAALNLLYGGAHEEKLANIVETKINSCYKSKN